MMVMGWGVWGVSPSWVCGRAPAGSGAEPRDRRVAAAYGDRSECFWRARTHICLLHFSEAERCKGGNVHNFLSTSRWYQCFSVLHSPTTADQESPYSTESYSIMHTLSGPPVAVPGGFGVIASERAGCAMQDGYCLM